MEEAIIAFLQSYPWGVLALAVLGSLVVVGQVVVAVTPSQSDDAWLAKVWELPVVGPFLKAVARFAPWQKP